AGHNDLLQPPLRGDRNRRAAGCRSLRLCPGTVHRRSCWRRRQIGGSLRLSTGHDRMKITDITITNFRSWADRWDSRYGVTVPKQELVQFVLTISTDEGINGYYFGGGIHGDQDALDPVNKNWVLARGRDLLIGQDPMDRELFWKWFWIAANIPE